MAKISNKKKYPEQEIVNKKDYVIGTDYYDRKKTKTFPIANLAQVLADILIEDGGIHIDVGKTSQLINDGEFGYSRFVEESEVEVIIQEIKDNLTNIQTWRDNLGIGILNNLLTTDKSNLVNAINELKAELDKIGDGDQAIPDWSTDLENNTNF